MPRIYFSLKQANELLGKIRPDVERLVELNEQLQMLDNTKIEFDEENVENFLLEVELNKNFHEKNVELYSLIGLLIRQGCIVRDLGKMEIDFYSRQGGKEILFCWRPIEENVKYWHYPKEGISKRKPIKQIEEEYLEQLRRMK
ncbi:MAG: DUF2203 family protein [Candidatus Diapherotrites archaeon]|nr:DUF2203 family protein [Candidatus Diapherotrites archaeon]